MKFHRTLGFRFAASSLAAVFVLVAVMLALLSTQSRSLGRELDALLAAHADSETGKVAFDVRLLCETMNEALQTEINDHLTFALHLLRTAGSVSAGSAPVEWRAVDQFTQSASRVRLPQLLVGGQWLGQNDDPGRRTPFVDEAQALVGGTVTVFQRMNERGDMLRVATTVKNERGRRAVGTYIPASGADGKPNPVVQSVLEGRRYQGRAFVVNAWYITGYEPLRDAAGKVIGMLYVGVPQDALVEPVRKALSTIVVGKSGFVWAMGASGTQRGRVFVARDGAFDQKNVLDTQDADGRAAFRELLDRGVATQGTRVEHARYARRDPGRAEARAMVTSLTYFAPWDWVIGVSVDPADYAQAREVAQAALGKVVRWSVVGAGVILCLLLVVLGLVTRSITARLHRLVVAAEAVSGGDLRESIEVGGRDEVAQLGAVFATMVRTMRELAAGLHGAVNRLDRVVDTLDDSASQQHRAITRQAAALQETQATALELKQTSDLAAQQAASVLQMASRAEEASRAGGAAIAQGVEGVAGLRTQTEELAARMKVLGERTRQVGGITESVKDLADQSNMLALNAAIEAARAGAQGRGFAVVAREVRTLADQSIEATNRVRTILQDIEESVASAVALSERGARHTESSLEEVRASGENLQQLASIVTENMVAVRQIAAAVGQQNAGVNQLFSAVADQNKMMEETVIRLEEANATVEALKQVAEQVLAIASAYRV